MIVEEMKVVISAINTDNTKLLGLLTIYDNAQILELSPVQMNKLKDKATALKESIINKLNSLPF